MPDYSVLKDRQKWAESIFVYDRKGNRSVDTASATHIAVRVLPVLLAALLLVVSAVTLVSSLLGRGSDHQQVQSLVAEREAEADAAEQGFRDAYRAGVDDFGPADSARLDVDVNQAEAAVADALDIAELAQFTGNEEVYFDFSSWLLTDAEADAGHEYFALVEVIEVPEGTDADELNADHLPVGGTAGETDVLDDADLSRQWLTVRFTADGSDELVAVEAYSSPEPLWSWVEADLSDDSELDL